MLEQLPALTQNNLQAKINLRKSQRQLLPFFWITIIAYTTFVFSKVYFNETILIEDVFGCLAISAASLLSVYLWCAGKAFGVPIFPIFSVTYLWTSALPLLLKNPGVFKYSNSERFFASMTVTGFLLLSTLIWYQFVKRFPQPKAYYRTIGIHKGENIFLGVLFISNLFTIFIPYISLYLDRGTFPIIRGAILALSAIATFAMSYRFGKGKLSQINKILYLVLLTANIISSAIGFLLVGSLSLFLIAIISYSIGKNKFPVIFAVIIFSLFAVLHTGKASMRQLYWHQTIAIQPWQYPAIFGEWFDFGLKGLFSQKEESGNSGQSIIERSSVIQQLLLTQSSTKLGQPLLYGSTYSIIPQLLIPRIFNPNKIISHEGTTILNVYYGIQTREDTLTTTIGWGLLAEAYANFGLLGCGLLACICGTVYGYIGLISINAPVFSDRYLLSILFFSYAFQTEFTAGVYVAALFQSLVTLFIFLFFFTKVQKIEAIEN
ncbi:hypothetical protein [Anabaena sp. AL93]|uniref:hypothetical protein n=1 Tax=Anabaena sp. AL93 TaxID=1678133 RepID=UPI0007FE18DC|nr:hypothetical protein [Anabaena sp. AL93]OBQ20697.1 MAG: hypothetical protein AN486_06130 [Anabaena sp. AL93]